MTPGIMSAVPAFTPPMLATSGRPSGALGGWVVEPKADGWRAQVAVHEGSCTVWTRTGRDITAKLPELTALTESGVDCVLDGELIAGAGLPADFYPLAGLMAARRRHQRLTFVAFDVLHLNGRSLLDYDLASRRKVLDCLVRLSDGALTAVNTFAGPALDDVLIPPSRSREFRIDRSVLVRGWSLTSISISCMQVCTKRERYL